MQTKPILHGLGKFKAHAGGETNWRCRFPEPLRSWGLPLRVLYEKASLTPLPLTEGTSARGWIHQVEQMAFPQ